MAKWKAWADGLGSRMVIPGMPLGQGKLISSDGIIRGRIDRLKRSGHVI